MHLSTWRFSLRFLLVGTAVISLVCYFLFASHYAKRARAIRELTGEGVYLGREREQVQFFDYDFSISSTLTIYEPVPVYCRITH